jgi:hypothetical protein
LKFLIREQKGAVAALGGIPFLTHPRIVLAHEYGQDAPAAARCSLVGVPVPVEVVEVYMREELHRP